LVYGAFKFDDRNIAFQGLGEKGCVVSEIVVYVFFVRPKCGMKVAVR